MKRFTFLAALSVLAISVGCQQYPAPPSARETRSVARQQAQYSKGQPVPAFNWSLERDLLIKLYGIRNQKVSTHSVWRSDYGTIEGDCPSFGYGMPYDVSLTNPLQATDIDNQGHEHQHHGFDRGGIGGALVAIGQAEPNGIFSSQNTAATWVFCVGDAGSLEPVYVESKVTVYPGDVVVDYDTNRVTRTGKANVTVARPGGDGPPAKQ